MVIMSTKFPVKLSDLSKQVVQDLIKSFKNFLFDCDGVLWHEKVAVPLSPFAVNRLKEIGKNVFYVTNKSYGTIPELLEKTKALNISAEEKDFVTVPNTLARWLKSHNFTKKCYVIGRKGLITELCKSGYDCIGYGPDVFDKNSLFEYIDTIKLDPEIGAVVVAFDPHFSVGKIIKATSYILKRNCLFIGTNIDIRHPYKLLNVPGSGCMVRCIEACTGKNAIIIGKPNVLMFEYLRDNFGVSSQDSVMIGDTLDTDIAFAKKCKMKSILVLTGNASLDNVKEHLESKRFELVPDFYLDSLGDLLEFLK